MSTIEKVVGVVQELNNVAYRNLHDRFPEQEVREKYCECAVSFSGDANTCGIDLKEFGIWDDDSGPETPNVESCRKSIIEFATTLLIAFGAVKE